MAHPQEELGRTIAEAEPNHDMEEFWLRTFRSPDPPSRMRVAYSPGVGKGRVKDLLD